MYHTPGESLLWNWKSQNFALILLGSEPSSKLPFLWLGHLPCIYRTPKHKDMKSLPSWTQLLDEVFNAFSRTKRMFGSVSAVTDRASHIHFHSTGEKFPHLHCFKRHCFNCEIQSALCPWRKKIRTIKFAGTINTKKATTRKKVSAIHTSISCLQLSERCIVNVHALGLLE